MKKLTGLLLVLIQFGVISTVLAQDKKVDRQRFFDLMGNSAKLTKDFSYRTLIVIEDSDSPDKDWQPYSSMVLEFVFPDRSYLSYKSRREGDFIRIGEYLYSRDSHGSPWIRTVKDDRWVSQPSNPAAQIGLGPAVDFSFVNNERNGLTVELVDKATREARVPYNVTGQFSFDERGTLYRKVSVAHNGLRFVRRIEKYEYDDAIKIVAPID